MANQGDQPQDIQPGGDTDREGVKKELEKFINTIGSLSSSSADSLEVWSNGYLKDMFPLLRPVALAVLSIPGSQAISERLFSLAGRFQTKTRGRLSPATHEALTMLKQASHHYRDNLPPKSVEIPSVLKAILPRKQGVPAKRSREEEDNV